MQLERRAVLPILITCLMWLPALVGLGGFILRLHGACESDRAVRRICLSGLYGLFTLSIIGTIANFFVGVHPALPVIAATLGWVLFIIHRRDFLRGMRARHFFVILAVLLVVALADARGRIRYDTGLYHLQAVKWITSQATPFGLANLYGRLGFNSAWFPAAAMLEGPLLHEKSTFILNALLMILFGIALVDSAEGLRRQGFNRADAFLLLAVYPWAAYGFDTGYASSLHPDFPVMLLTCLVGMLWLMDEDECHYARHAVTLSVFAVMIKLSAAPLLIGAIAIWICRQRRKGGSIYKIAPLAGVWAIALLAWIVRGVVLSGCLFYPSTLGRMSGLHWTVPIVRMRYEVELIQDWGRYWMVPEHIVPGQAWFKPWAKRLWSKPDASARQIKVILGLLAVGMLIAILPGKPRVVIRKWIALLLVAGAGILYWFLTAPDPRFGYGYFFLLAAGIFCMGLERLPKRQQIILMCACGLAFTYLLRGYVDGMKEIALARWPRIPIATLITRQNSQGITIYVPVDDDRAWAAPLPATPFFDPALRCNVDANGRFHEFWLDPSAPVLAVP